MDGLGRDLLVHAEQGEVEEWFRVPGGNRQFSERLKGDIDGEGGMVAASRAVMAS